MDDLDGDFSLRKLLVNLISHPSNIINLVLSKRLVPLSQIKGPVELIEGDHAKFLLHEIVHHDAQLLIRKFCL